MLQKSVLPMWEVVSSTPVRYQKLAEDEICDVAVIGAGITGIFCSYRFSSAGIDTVLLEKNTVCSGVSGSSIGVINYLPIDSIASILRYLGTGVAHKIVSERILCADNIEQICNSLNINIEQRNIVNFTQNIRNVKKLKNIFSAFSNINYDVRYLTSHDVENMFPFYAFGGIMTESLGSQLNPFEFVHALAIESKKNGARIYENSEAVSISENGGRITVICENGRTVKAKKAVITATSLSDIMLSEASNVLNRADVLLTNPLDELTGWTNGTILECNDRGKLTVRATDDKRIAISYDRKITPFNQICEDYCKSVQLEKVLKHLFPEIGDVRSCVSRSYYYKMPSGKLPFVKKSPIYRNIYFVICSQLDGILYAEAASRKLVSGYIN